MRMSGASRGLTERYDNIQSFSRISKGFAIAESIENLRYFNRELLARILRSLATLAETRALNTLYTLRESSRRMFTNPLPISLAFTYFPIAIYIYFNYHFEQQIFVNVRHSLVIRYG